MWIDGKIDDFTYASGLAHLIKIDVIKVDNVQVDSEGVIAIDEHIIIDPWIKQQAGWWAKGETTDRDYTGSAGYMIKNGVIAFTEKPKQKQIDPPSLQLDSGPADVDPKLAQLVFETATQNEVSMSYLQKIKAAEYEMIKNAYDIALKDYSENKDQDSMNAMVSLGNAEKKAKDDSIRAIQIHKTAVQLAKDAKAAAVSAGLHVLDLEA